jgi:hypothetical protein
MEYPIFYIINSNITAFMTSAAYGPNYHIYQRIITPTVRALKTTQIIQVHKYVRAYNVRTAFVHTLFVQPLAFQVCVHHQHNTLSIILTDSRQRFCDNGLFHTSNERFSLCSSSQRDKFTLDTS